MYIYIYIYIFYIADAGWFDVRHPRLHVATYHCALGRDLPKEALLHEDVAVNASDLYGPGHV